MPEDTYEMILPLASDAPEFALGFEAGIVYATLRDQRPDNLDNTYHTKNEGQLRDIAHREGYKLDWQPHDEEWAFGTFTRLEE